MKEKFDYIIVGAGLCGLVIAEELSKKNKRVLILEKGRNFKYKGLSCLSPFYYDKAALARSSQGIFVYRTLAIGGTTIVNLGNAIEPSEEEIDKIGIDFRKEFSYLRKKNIFCVINWRTPFNICSSFYIKC